MLLASKNVGSVTILNRTVERAQKIADEVNRNFADADKNFAAKVTAMPISEYRSLSGEKYLVIQATSVGMTPNTDEAVIEDEDFYKKVHTGYDLIFNPLDTKFMKLVRAQGGRTFCGYKMLLYQGIIAYEYWTGKTVSQELAAKVYQRMLDSMGH
jgi:shikimate dehydrogenase